MGANRNGARTVLNILQRACRLSRLPGFRTGLNNILGAETATLFIAVWEPLCSFVDVIVGLDDFFNQKDTSETDGAGEDGAVG